MALAPLATVTDAQNLGLVVPTEEIPLLEAYLAAASAAVRDAAGAPIGQTTSTITAEAEATQRLHLPGPPVTSVSSVTVDGAPVTDYRLTSGTLWRAGGWSSDGTPRQVQVTYTHGLPEVPSDIVMLVCRIAAATLLAWRAETDGTGLAATDIRQERIGDYSVTYGGDGRITELELSDRLTRRLAKRFGGGVGLVRSR
ncbi:hypothetical protein [Nocardiopsis sp. FIRDI 009]|uniref:hypothetical protein n=1 Tax=Nocardiopsis sp. FIRDI 009 TaxID=714197 RepID=UPI000E2816C5|nr:hypothetical protein [Nocardiopsis sp. FIRDI 009]